MSKKIELSNVDITVCVLYLLGGTEKLVDEEDVAMKCWEYVPEKFSWEKYPHYPDSAPARFGLGDALKEKNGQLVKRSTRYSGQHKKKEYILTQSGIELAKLKMKNFKKLIKGEVEVKSNRQVTLRFLNQLEKHVAFIKYLRDKNLFSIEKFEFTDFIRCNLDSTPIKILERFNLTRNKALDNNNQKIVKFLDEAKDYFKDLFPKE